MKSSSAWISEAGRPVLTCPPEAPLESKLLRSDMEQCCLLVSYNTAWEIPLHNDTELVRWVRSRSLTPPSINRSAVGNAHFRSMAQSFHVTGPSVVIGSLENETSKDLRKRIADRIDYFHVPGRKENPEAADFSLSLDSMAHTKNKRLVARKIRYLLIHETVYQAPGIDSVPIKIGNFVKTMKDGADCQGLCQFG